MQLKFLRDFQDWEREGVKDKKIAYFGLQMGKGVFERILTLTSLKYNMWFDAYWQV